jgi:hypothetical protein
MRVALDGALRERACGVHLHNVCVWLLRESSLQSGIIERALQQFSGPDLRPPASDVTGSGGAGWAETRSNAVDGGPLGAERADEREGDDEVGVGDLEEHLERSQ